MEDSGRRRVTHREEACSHTEIGICFPRTVRETCRSSVQARAGHRRPGAGLYGCRGGHLALGDQEAPPTPPLAGSTDREPPSAQKKHKRAQVRGLLRGLGGVGSLGTPSGQGHGQGAARPAAYKPQPWVFAAGRGGILCGEGPGGVRKRQAQATQLPGWGPRCLQPARAAIQEPPGESPAVAPGMGTQERLWARVTLSPREPTARGPLPREVKTTMRVAHWPSSPVLNDNALCRCLTSGTRLSSSRAESILTPSSHPPRPNTLTHTRTQIFVNVLTRQRFSKGEGRGLSPRNLA